MKTRLLALLLCLVLVCSVLGACGGSSDETSSGADTSNESVADESTTSTEDSSEADTPAEPVVYRTLYATEVTTMNYLCTPNTYEKSIGANTVDTLIEYDNKGNMLPSLATEWSYNADTKEWTFTIREGVKWIDHTGKEVADVTAQDFVDAMKYSLDPANGSETVQLFFGIIKNAKEYYNYLSYKDGYTDEDGNVIPAGFDADGNEWPEISFDEVGAKVVDGKLVYTLVDDVPYFLSSTCYANYMPAYGPYLEQYGAGFATTNDKMLYCGAYYLSEFVSSQKQILTKNPVYWDKDKVYIDVIQKTYNAEANTTAPEMVLRGELDYAGLDSDILNSWLEDEEKSTKVSQERPSIDYSYFYCFNFNPQFEAEYEPENWKLAVNNENFRQSMMAALNRYNLVAISGTDEPYNFIYNTITLTSFTKNSAGVDYSELEPFKDIMAADFYNEDEAKAYRDAAKTELTAAGATFPVKVLVKYNPNDTDWEKECILLEQEMEAVLGTDYIDIIVEAGPSTSFLTEVRRSGKYAFMKCNWGADYADPESYTDPFYQNENINYKYGFMATTVDEGTAAAETVSEYFRLVEVAKAEKVDLDKRYELFAAAEAYLIEHSLAIPYGASVSSYVATKLNVFEGQYAPFGVSALRYKGQKLYDHFITMEEYTANKEAVAAE